MTVQELIAYLQKQNSLAEVVLAKDEEGNSFSPLANAEVKQFSKRRPWDYEPDDYGDSMVVLWPMN